MYDPKTSVQVDKVDVYMLGNVLYYVHTNHWLYEGLSNEKAMSKIYQGEHSPYPGKIQTSGSPVVIALSKAIEMCWTRDWQSRPTARQVSDYLMSALRDHEVDVENVVRVTMPPLGKNHRFTDSDFYTNLDY